MSIATMPVRVFNASYEDLGPTTLDSAIKLVFVQGRAEIIEEDESRIIRTMGGKEFFLPKVIRLFKMKKVPFYMADEYFTREGLLRRDNYTCGYCGITAAQGASLTHDHIYPKSRGGADSWKNAMTACLKCNGTKADRTPEEAGMTLTLYPWTPQRMYFRSEKARRARKNK